MRATMFMLFALALTGFVVFILFYEVEKALQPEDTTKQILEGEKTESEKIEEENTEPEKIMVQIDDLGPARLLVSPHTEDLITMIPIREKLEILDSKKVTRGMTNVIWYKVKYNNSEGWISQYVTTGKLIKKE